MAYATASDLADRWRLLSAEEAEVAETLLGDASEILDELGFSDKPESLLRIVACNMVRRAMERHGNAFGVGGQYDETLGWETTLPAGELYPFEREIKLLTGGQSIGFIPMADLRNE